jgi:hypothetical protein
MASLVGQQDADMRVERRDVDVSEQPASFTSVRRDGSTLLSSTARDGARYEHALAIAEILERHRGLN